MLPLVFGMCYYCLTSVLAFHPHSADLPDPTTQSALRRKGLARTLKEDPPNTPNTRKENQSEVLSSDLWPSIFRVLWRVWRISVRAWVYLWRATAGRAAVHIEVPRLAPSRASWTTDIAEATNERTEATDESSRAATVMLEPAVEMSPVTSRLPPAKLQMSRLHLIPMTNDQ